MTCADSNGAVRRRDHDDVERRVEEHLELADRLARRFGHGRRLDDDLRQVARLGLLLASRRYDPERGEFARFAAVTIVGELKKELRSHGWVVRVPRSLQEDSITVASASDRLATSLGRLPSVGEVGESVGFERERVMDAVRAREARFGAPGDRLDETMAGPGDLVDSALLGSALGRLTPDQRELVRYRFHDGLTQSEIGHIIGVSQPQVHRRLTEAIALLRSELEEHEA